jgi:hypothetical protein
MDVPINVMQWEVFLPEQYKVKDFAGDVIEAGRVPMPLLEQSNVGYGSGGGIGSGDGVGFGPTSGTVIGGLARGVGGSFGKNAYRARPHPPSQMGGSVFDPSGATIAGATVSVTGSENGFAETAVTDQSGQWLVGNMSSGRYKLSISAPGFNTSVANVQYDAGQPSDLGFTLNLGAVRETVTVEAESVSQLPTNGRNFTTMASLQPGVAQPNSISANVVNLQRRIAGVLPVAIEVPRSGTSFRFVRPLVLNEETKVTFNYKNK